jgi:urea transport system permease protein
MIRLIIAISLFILPCLARAVESTQEERALIAKAMVEEDAQAQASQISALAGKASPAMLELLQQWKEGVIYIYTDEDGAKTPVIPLGEKDADDKQLAKKFVDNAPLNDPQGAPLKVGSTDIETADTSSTLRVAMKTVTDMAALVEPDIKKRIQAIQNLGLQQDPEKLPALQTALKTETDSDAKHALAEAIAFVELKSEDAATKLAACQKLGELNSIPSQDVLKTLKAEAETAGNTELAAAAQASLDLIATHVRNVNTVGTMFRGLSTGSVLLVVAIGLAITFGLMGVINMAHGEMLVVGAYTTYIVQNLGTTGISGE